MCVALGLATVFKSGPDDFQTFTRGAYTGGGTPLYVNGTDGDVETCGSNLIPNPRYGTSPSGDVTRLPTEAAFVMIRDPSEECVSSSASLPLVGVYDVCNGCNGCDVYNVCNVCNVCTVCGLVTCVWRRRCCP